MRFIYLLIFSVLASCAHVVIEERLVPSMDKPSIELDTKVYHPSDISNILTLDEIELFIDTNNYETSYKGLKVAGIELNKETNSKNKKSDALVLILGIKVKKDEKYVFHPYEIIASKNVKGSISIAKPISVFRTNSGITCDYDFNGVEWGGDSTKIKNKTIDLLKVHEDGYECFNVVFDTTISSLDELTISMKKSLSPLKQTEIYFQQKKIKWIRGN
ncbi:MAG: hypothetical protein ACJAS1_007236 [Oleiphilaceae bacterium]|jgi:hypothetical protein